MRIIAVNQDLLSIPAFREETEFRDKDGRPRPFVLVVMLDYKNKKYSFALPFRSNIPKQKVSPESYFPLPKRHTTKPNHAHGLHYKKMFPIEKRYFQKYNIYNSPYYTMLYEFINANKEKIIAGAQNYLVNYEHGKREVYCTNICMQYNDMTQ